MLIPCKHLSSRAVQFRKEKVIICNRCNSLISAPQLRAILIPYHDRIGDERAARAAARIKKG